MAVIAGIDEAGFGPLMGPLVVTAAAFSVPDELAEACMWRCLAGAVSKKPSKRRPTIPIADSKKLYAGLRDTEGLAHLERGVLSMLATRACRPGSLSQLLEAVCPGAWEQAQAYPWHRGADLPLPHAVTPTSLALAGNSLAAALAQAGVSLLEVRSELVFTGEFNRLARAINNKSRLLFDISARLLMHLWRSMPAGPIKVFLDHQGGRIRYLPGLQRVFHGCQFKVVEECEELSAYTMTDGARRAEICFAVGCEDRQMPVALASMASKYLRELCMAPFNRFWARHVPNLAPTAGYYADGRRFHAEIQAAARELGVDDGILCRER